MKGAYCLFCKEKGPDLVIGEDSFPTDIPDLSARLAFTCSRCGSRWTWIVSRTPDGQLEYLIVP